MRKLILSARFLLAVANLGAQQPCPKSPVIINTPEDQLMLAVNGADSVPDIAIGRINVGVIELFFQLLAQVKDHPKLLFRGVKRGQLGPQRNGGARRADFVFLQFLGAEQFGQRLRIIEQGIPLFVKWFLQRSKP